MSTKQPITPLDKAQRPLFLGIDVGGTNTKIGLVDNVGNTLGYTIIDTEEPRGPADAMKRVVVASKQMLEALGLKLEDVARVGLGTPGSQDIPKGMLIAPPNHPHWHNFPIVACLESEIGIGVSFANDANAAGWGEFWVGTGAKYSSMVLLTLGTGVGGGIIIDNKLVVGHSSFGGECGHMIIDPSPDARLCAWGGGRGHLEAYASASAVAMRAKERISSGTRSILTNSIKEITAKSVYEAAAKGDELALEIVESTADYLAIGITTIVHMVDPGLVVLGGAMNFGGTQSPIGQRFLARIQKTFQQLTFEYVFKGTTIEFASLGGDAGYLGAAGIAQADYHASQKKSA